MNLSPQTISEFVNAQNVCRVNKNITNITTDTREVNNGSLFVALKGEKFDGHDFIDEAIKKGAVLAVSEKNADEFSNNDKIIKVESTYKALLDIAAGYRKMLDLNVVAVTGSVGKTTTKDMCAAVLSQKFKTVKTQGNLNNHIGLPKTVFNIAENTQAAVIEMGMSHFNEISRLTAVAVPDVAVITSIGVSHIENLGSRENILKAKLEILESMKSNAPVIINSDNDMLSAIESLGEHKIIRCGVYDENADVRAENVKECLEGTYFDIYYKNEYLTDAHILSAGIHNVQDALLAAAVGIYYSIDADKIKNGLLDYVPSGMRQKIEKFDEKIFIEDCYNASPDSMRAALNVLSKYTDMRKIAVLGDMLELGDYSDRAHCEIGAYTKGRCDILVACGSKAELIFKTAEQNGVESFYFETRQQAADFLKNELKNNDCVLFKASHSMMFEKIIEPLKADFKEER